MEPRLVAAAVLAAALISTRLAAGSAGGAVPTVRPIPAQEARISVAHASLPIASVLTVDEASVDGSGGMPTSALSPRRPMVAKSEISAAAIVVSGAARPTATPRPAAVQATKLLAKATVERLRLAPTPKPVPAIVYLHQATGRATWGAFGGAVITRPPPGTPIRVCGRLGCWAGVSSGYGPSAGGGNLVDMDAAVFQRVCGLLGTGVGSIVLSWR